MNVLRKSTSLQKSSPFSLIQIGIFAAVLVGLLAVSSQSLWIDEGNTAFKVTQPTWMGFVSSMASELGSDVQMPLYMALLWAWEKVSGPSEFALRAFNIPWLLLAVWSVGQLCIGPPGIKTFSLGVLLTSPFVWYYLNEARPYAMQIGAAFLSIVSLCNILEGSHEGCRKRHVWMFAVGCLLLSGSSLVGMLFSGFFCAALAMALFFSPKTRGSVFGTRGWWLPALVSAPLFGALLFYYLWTLSAGARASPLGSGGGASLLYAAYELFGFTGLGPERLAIRQSGFSAFKPHAAPLMAMTAVFASVVAAAAVASRREGGECRPFLRAFCAGAVIALISVGALCIVSAVTGFRLLGRHLTPIFPMVVFGLAFALLLAWRSPFGKIASGLAIGMALVSALLLRFDPRHAHEDYRSAARAALDVISEGGVVWWAADRPTGNYYRVPFRSAANPSGAVHLFCPRERDLSDLPNPELVVFSRPDVYDRHSALQLALEQRKAVLSFQGRGFTFYTFQEKAGR